MSSLKIGDRVETLDDIISGIVTQLAGQAVTIRSDDGFPLIYDISELVKISDTSALKVSNYEIARAKAQKEESKRGKVQRAKPKDRSAPKMEVDLHIHKLVKSTKGLGKHDILTLQLETAKRQLEFAMAKRIQKVVFIHGMGEGILKEELTYLLGRYEQLKFYDADYRKYGLGATEVYIFQNT
ncbi:Smr/MutS family protein [Spongiimicrobium sp. 2-473A-2-J]|uniref:Smr/MutS family protein n=1 Tax=Eudoraea algarum TaxID=3417568 RepID=UPI003D36109D